VCSSDLSMFQWFFIGAILGPLALPIAWSTARTEVSGLNRPLEPGVGGSGTVNVLVGIDGSAEAARALQTVVEILGTNVGRLTLASVVTFDEGSVAARRDEEQAVRLLAEAGASIAPHSPGQVVLTGQPATALMHHATEEGYDLLVIGRRGRGATKALLGSTAKKVADGQVPALIV